MIDKNKNLFRFFFIIYLFIGTYLSLTTGISHDEYHEQLKKKKNIEGIISFLSTGEYKNLINYIKNVLSNNNSMSDIHYSNRVFLNSEQI